MPIECPKCSNVIAASLADRPPPWCPRCGSGLVSTPAAPPAAVPVAAHNPYAEALTGGERPRFDPGVPKPRPAPERDGVMPEDESTTPERVFTSKIVWQLAAWATSLVCFGIAGIAVTQIINPPKKKPNPGAIYGVIGLFGIGGLVGAYVGLRLRGQKYEVFPDRLVEWQAGSPTNFRWDQISAVYRIAHPGWTQFRVQTRAGHSMLLTGDTSDHIRLGELISERVAAVMLPGALRDLDAGRDIPFGPLRVSRSGVQVKDEFVPWHQIVSLTFGLNPNAITGAAMVSNMIHLRITPANQVELGDVPNYRLFEELLRHLHPTCVAAEV